MAGFSFGAALADCAMGAALGLGTLFGQPVEHLSLVHSGCRPAPDAGAAPAWLFVVAPRGAVAVAAVVWRRLERDRPTEEQGALAVGAMTAAGFAAAAWLAALVGRIVWWPRSPPPDARGSSEGALALLLGRGCRDRHARQPLARTRPLSSFLALLWGLAGGLGAAFLWASRHNARWQVGAPGPVPPPPAAPAAQEVDAGGEPPEEKP